jgi:hypothetical protein
MLYGELTERMMANYNLFLFALFGRYQQIRAPGIEVTPRALTDLQVDAYALAKTFVVIAETEFDNYLYSLVEDRSSELVALLTHRKSEALILVRGMVAENVKQVVSLGKTGVRDFASLLKGGARGAMGLLVQRKMAGLEFKVTDTSGRKWGARTLMRVVIRDFAYQSWIDFSLQSVRDAGVDLVEVQYSDESKNFVMSMSGASGHPSLADIRDTIFHPNSNAAVESYVSS